MGDFRNISIFQGYLKCQLHQDWIQYQVTRQKTKKIHSDMLITVATKSHSPKISVPYPAFRNIDDLGLALAPYRGQNFFAFHGNVRNEDLTQDQGLCWEAWYECDGFTYNVTRTAGQPTSKVRK